MRLDIPSLPFVVEITIVERHQASMYAGIHPRLTLRYDQRCLCSSTKQCLLSGSQFCAIFLQWIPWFFCEHHGSKLHQILVVANFFDTRRPRLHTWLWAVRSIKWSNGGLNGTLIFFTRCAVTGGTVQLLYWPQATLNAAVTGEASPVTVGPIHQSSNVTHMSY